MLEPSGRDGCGISFRDFCSTSVSSAVSDREVAPWLVAGEEHPVVADTAVLDLPGQPVRCEADGPGEVGVDALAGLDPVEEPGADELDVAAHPAAEVHEMDGDLIGVPLHQVADLVDVGGGAGGGVDVHDQAQALGLVEDPVEERAAGRVGGAAAEQEAELQRPHAVLAGQREGTGGAVLVLGARGDPQPGPDPVVALRGLDGQFVEREGDAGVRHAVVGDHQGPFGALRVEIGDELLDGGASCGVGVDGRAAVEGVGGQYSDVAVGVEDHVGAPFSRWGGRR
jgi:hypothetical protein